MENKQPKLLNDSRFAHLSAGPLFEAEPGWGFKIKKWLKKNFIGKILPGIAILILGVGLFSFFRRFRNVNNQTPEPRVISQVITPNDSKTLLARKALADYLAEFPVSLSNGQKIFIEENLRRKITGAMVVGERLKFKIEDIKTAIDESQSLSPLQLQKWEGYAKNVRF